MHERRYYVETGLQELEDPTKGTSTDQIKEKWIYKTKEEIGYPNACSDAPPTEDATEPEPDTTTPSTLGDSSSVTKLEGYWIPAIFTFALAHYVAIIV